MASRRTSSERLSDQDILRRLQQNHGMRVVEKGGGGNCFFLSCADQVMQIRESAMELPDPRIRQALQEQRYTDMTLAQRATVLRWIAVAQERILLEAGDCAFALELFKDMAQELMGWREAQVRQCIDENKWSTKQRLQYVAENQDEYLQKEALPGTYAGNAEAWALSVALGRNILLYGNDYASRLEVCVDAKSGVVLPYFVAPPNQPIDAADTAAWAAADAPGAPITVFQVCGGGHYRALEGPRHPQVTP